MAPRKPKKNEATPPKIDWSGNLADFKNVVANTKPTQSAQPFVGKRTGTQRPNRGPDTGMFAGQSTPLGTAIGLTDTSAKKIVATATLAIGAGSIPKIVTSVGKSGLANQILNAVKKEEVIVHGSPTAGIKKLEPRVAYKGDEHGPQVWGMRVFDKGSSAKENIGEIARFTEKYGRKFSGEDNQGSIYVAKVKIRDTNLVPSKQETGLSKVDQFRQANGMQVAATPRPIIKFNKPTIVRSSSPAKVFEEIPLANKSQADLIGELTKTLKRAGVKLPRK